MLPKIILVDDDETSLIAMKKLVPWSDCGFELAGAFSCSDDAIDFADENHVDVMITDICMPKPDGLDLVEMFSKTHPEVKIIILSAHREFSYAQKALRYKNVVEYMTKPLDYQQLISVLSGLDTAQEKISSFSSKDDIYERLQFFSNLLCGNIAGSEALNKGLSSLGIDYTQENSVCTLVVFHIRDFRAFLNKASNYSSIQLYHIMSNMHPFSTEDGYFSLAMSSYNNISWIILHKSPDIKAVIEDFSAKIATNFDSILGLEVAVSSCKTHSTISELVVVPAISDAMEPTDDNDDAVINSAINYINDHISENLSLEEVASHVFMSPAYFSAYFKKKTGKKFIDKLTSIRMEKAAYLITTDDSLSAAEISSLIGYNHIGYFYRKFKSYFGLTPTEYKTNRQK